MTFFGPDSWGRYTFFNPLGPIAVAEQPAETQPAAFEKLNQLRWLDDRLNTLITTLQPSLENNASEGPGSPLKNTLIRSGTPWSKLARCTPN